jgi:O-antigen ligase
MELFSTQNRQKYFEYLHYILAFFFPIFPRLLPILIINITLLWLLEGKFIYKFKLFFSSKKALAFISLYFFYIVGMVYTQDVLHGLRDLETKFTLLLFPFIYATSENINKIKSFNIFKYLAYGCAVAAFIGLSKSSYSFFYELYARSNNIILESYPYTNYFFSAYVSLFLHTGYFALYINVSIAFLFYHVLIHPNEINHKTKKIFISFLIFLSIYNVLLLSKIGLITMIAIYIFIFLIWAKERLNFLKLTGITMLLILFVSIIIFALPKVRLNFENVIETTFSKNERELDSEDGSASRLVAWKTAFDLVKKHFLIGVGTGDVKQTLTLEYQKRAYWNAYEIKLNSHNQFLQTTLAIGIAGLFSLLLFVFINFRNAYKNKNIIHLIFISAVCMQFMVEASLETQAGVIFISFFNSAFNFIFTKSDFNIKQFNHEK